MICEICGKRIAKYCLKEKKDPHRIVNACKGCHDDLKESTIYKDWEVEELEKAIKNKAITCMHACMSEERKLELLAYAAVCFENCTNPFEFIHLQKKKVNADECRDLSHLIAEIIDEYMYYLADKSKTKIYTDVAKAKLEAEKDYKETQ